ncbi:MAG: TPM domain-containing protein [Steroidobacteraceae bacterium]
MNRDEPARPGNLRLVLLLSLLVAVVAYALLGERQWFRKSPPYAAESQDPAVAAASIDALAAAPAGRVVDPDGIAGVFAEHLVQMGDTHLHDLGVDIQIVIAGLHDGDIGAAAARLFNARRIGEDSPTGGILILVDPRNRRAKIEVSHALEGVLTDGTVGWVAKNQLAPYASYNAIGMALMDTMHMITDYLYVAALQGRLVLGEQFKARAEYQSRAESLSGGAGAATDIKDVRFDDHFKRPVGQDRATLYAPSSDPLESAEAFSRALRDMVGDPGLALFTPESGLMRSIQPVAPFEYRQRFARLEESRPLRAIVRGDYAVVTSERPAHGFVPILLKRIDGSWRVDAVETWKNLFFGPDGEYFLRNANTPYLFGLSKYGRAESLDALALPIPASELPELINRLQSQETALAHFRLGEIYFRNTFSALTALHHYETAVALAPRDPLYAEVLAERYLHLWFPDAAIRLLQKQGPYAYLKLARAQLMAEDLPAAEQALNKALELNPFSVDALWLLADLSGRQGDAETKEQLVALVHGLQRDRLGHAKPVALTFKPAGPQFHANGRVRVAETDVYGYSEFAVTMTNTSGRPVRIEKVILRSLGDAASSGLGDIVGYFRFPDVDRVLSAGASASFHKEWGFVTPIKDRRMTYQFETCWQGLDEPKRQCAIQRLHLE